MAKKKQKKASNSTQSAYAYISSGRARALPMGDCFINAGWKESGLANLVITRKHVTGNLTFASFLVDLFWKGIKNTHVLFNAPEEDLQKLFDYDIDLVPIDYNTAHNIIYGGEAFAADYDIKPHPDFEISRMILEEDDDRIPIIDIEFGKDGKPFMIADMGDGNYDSSFRDTNDDYNANDFDEDFPPFEDGEDMDEVWPVNKSMPGESKWQQELRDSDLTVMLTDWTESDWEKFFDNPKIQGQGDSFIDQVLLYVFDKCYTDLNPEPGLDWNAVMKKFQSENFNITSKAIQADNYINSEKEQDLIVECYLLLESGDEREFRNQYKQKLKQLQAAIERWPDNKQLYNSLQNFYMAAGEEQKLEELLERSIKRFPGYLFGLVNYANHQLEKGKPEMVPPIMKWAYNITDLYPDRALFHVSEIFSFNQVWLVYFMSTKQMMKARHYSTQLQLNVPPQFSGMKKLKDTFRQLDNICIGTMKLYLDKQSKDPEHRGLMIEILLNYSELYRLRK